MRFSAQVMGSNVHCRFLYFMGQLCSVYKLLDLRCIVFFIKNQRWGIKVYVKIILYGNYFGNFGITRFGLPTELTHSFQELLI